ncbi:GNAT family N-acetyltransferase [Micromonospora sp. WMMA1363]|uniref:GNAT family N-acetyltransferase n=1 Tax=Micromonospora sp. WMMA1363 TaxID=3053985 RepID=UPI00259CA63C|nr:GNAT family N-acetyltransferase [Micromonospora sp. WMMA1363]MDM4720317.1 GNAT family N-acetyltransferase [Micromonospora sp. WMMA1363]
MLITARTASDPELAALLAAQQRELGDTGWAGLAGGPPEDLRFLVAVLGDRAVAFGGLRAYDDGTGEVHRLYVRPACRKRGVARQLLAALEELAFQAGHAVLRLRTTAHLATFYTACGYQRIPGYGEPAPDTVCFAKRLPVAASDFADLTRTSVATKASCQTKW